MQATQAQRGQGAVFHIEIYADSTCPWCYIGTRFLNIAKATLPGAVFRLRWKPYQIAPDVGKQGEGMRELMESRYGKAIDLDDPNSPLAKAAVAAGVSLASGGAMPGNSEASTCGSGFLSRRVWNSTASHKIIQAAGKQEVQKPGLQTAVVEAIFEAYFIHDANIADEQVLVSLAAQAGMANPQEALRSSKLADRVANFKEAAAVKGVEAAPFFFISRQGYPGCYRLSGAQPAQVFIRAFESLLIDREQLVRMLRAKQQGDRSQVNSPSSAASTSAKPAETSTDAAAGEHTRTIRGAGYCSSAPPLSSSSDCSEPLPGRSRKRSRTDMFGTDVSRRSGDSSAEDANASADSDIHAAAAALLSARHVSSPTAAAAPPPQKARTLPQQAWSDGDSSQAATVSSESGSSSAARSPFAVSNDTSTGSVRPCAYFSQGLPAASAAAAHQRQAGRVAMLSGSRSGQQRDARSYQPAAPFEQPRYAVAAAAAAAPVQPHQRAQQQHVIHYMSADVSTSAASSAPYAVTLVPVTRCGSGMMLAPLRGYIGGGGDGCRQQQQRQQAWLPQHPHGFAPRTWPQYAADRRVQADL